MLSASKMLHVKNGSQHTRNEAGGNDDDEIYDDDEEDLGQEESKKNGLRFVSVWNEDSF